MVSVSEGTPGRGPDADSRTDTGDGQASTNGRPAVPPVRYGPRNGQPGGPRGGAGSRPAAAPNAPQQYRAPQPPRGPATGGANGTTPNGTNGTGSNGSASNGSAANSSAANGSGANGTRTPPPSSYTRPRSNGATAKPQPSEQERSVTEARIAAAARNASAARVRGGSALSGNRPAPTSAADDTAVIPAVTPDRREDTTPTEPAKPDATTEQQAPEATPEKGRSRFGRLRDRRPAPDASAPAAVAASTVEDKAASTSQDGTGSTTGDKTETGPTVAASAPEARTEPDTDEATPEPAASPRPLTWRDRLGLPPKEPKPQPVVVPAPGPGVPTAAAAAAVAASVAAGTAPPETKASPSGPTTAPQLTPVQGRVTPSSPVAGTTDTITIPAVDAGSVGPASPAAAATAQPLVTAKPRVGAARRTRKARLRLSRVDPWSVMKTALLFSIAAGIILVVATYGVWSVLNASGLFDAVNDMVKSVVSTPGDTTPFRIEEYVNTQKIIGVAALIAVVDVLIFTALATLGSFLYNLAATVLGGLEVTLAED